MINVVLRLLVSLRSMAGSSYRKKQLYCAFGRISLYLFLLVVLIFFTFYFYCYSAHAWDINKNKCLLIKLTEGFGDMKHRRTLDFGLEAFLF